MVLRKGQYTITDKHRKHLSQSAKDWWAIPENKERMSQSQTGTHRLGWSVDSKKKLSDSMIRSWNERKNRGDNKSDG